MSMGNIFAQAKKMLPHLQHAEKTVIRMCGQTIASDSQQCYSPIRNFLKTYARDECFLAGEDDQRSMEIDVYVFASAQ